MRTLPLRSLRTRLTDAVLQLPLLWKLAGASTVIACAAIVAVLVVEPSIFQKPLVTMSMLVILASIAMHAALVAVALSPIRVLEQTASRVRRGDMAARVPRSPFADRDMRRVADTVNLLLDELASERARMRLLASHTIHQTEAERSRIGRELHDSAAQQLAALMYELSAAARDSRSDEIKPRLEAMRSTAAVLMEDLRKLSTSVHPRVLEDLGLRAAVEALARPVREQGVCVKLSIDPAVSRLSRDTATLMHVVIEEALRNAQQHGHAECVDIAVRVDDDAASLSVFDDGVGFVPDGKTEVGGLFSLRQRVTLADGIFAVESSPGRGTLVSVRVPLDGAN